MNIENVASVAKDSKINGCVCDKHSSARRARMAGSGPRSDDHVPFRLQLILSLVKPEGVGRSGAIFLNIMCDHVFSG